MTSLYLRFSCLPLEKVVSWHVDEVIWLTSEVPSRQVLGVAVVGYGGLLVAVLVALEKGEAVGHSGLE